MIVLEWLNSAWCWAVENLLKITAGWVLLAVTTGFVLAVLIRRGEKQRPRACMCGCESSVHEHYRSGTDCGSCGPDVCDRYRPVPQDTGQHIKPPVGTTVHIDGDESGRLLTFQPDGRRPGPVVPEVKSCKREIE